MNAHTDPATLPPSSVNSSGETPAPGKIAQSLSQPGIVAGVVAFDAAANLLAGFLTSRLWLPEFGKTVPIVALALVLVTAISLSGMGRKWAYTIPALRSLTRQTAQTGLWLFTGIGAIIVGAYLLGWPLDGMRYWLAFWFASGWGTIVANRIALSFWLKAKSRSGALARRTVIAGGGTAAASLIESLQRSDDRDIRTLGIFDDRDGERSPRAIGRYLKLGNFDQLEAFCREQQVDLIIVALPPSAEERILQLLKKLLALPIDIRVSAHGSKLKLRERAYTRIANVPFLPLFDKPMSD